MIYFNNVSQIVRLSEEVDVNKYLKIGWKIISIEKEVFADGETSRTTFVLGWDKIEIVPAECPKTGWDALMQNA